MRAMFTTLIAIVLVCVTTIFVLYAKNMDADIQSFSPQVDCDPNVEITPEAAEQDFLKGDEQQGLMYCICKEALFAQIENSDYSLTPRVDFPSG